jgi:hypothetical protein
MPRAHNIPVPDSDTEIIEVTAYRQKTKRGVKIKKNEVPMAQPLPAQSSKASSSREKKKRTAQLQKNIDNTIPEEPASEVLEAIGDIEYNYVEGQAEEISLQAKVYRRAYLCYISYYCIDSYG